LRRIAIITDDPGWHGKQLILAFAKAGFAAEYVSLTECTLRLADENQSLVLMQGFEHKLPDAVFIRGVPGGSLEEVIFYLDILHAFKMLGVPVYNDGRAIERSVDKAMTSFLLRHAHIETPATWVTHDREIALAIAERELTEGHLLISKPLFGSQGEGIRRIEKPSDLLWLTSSHGIYYLQRFIECNGKEYSDIRVFVINGKAIAAMRRCGVSWLNNVARGASCEQIPLNDTLVEVALRAVAELQMDYAGVDLIQQRCGRYSVIEINSVPAWKGLQSVCDINIAECLVNDLSNRYLS